MGAPPPSAGPLPGSVTGPCTVSTGNDIILLGARQFQIASASSKPLGVRHGRSLEPKHYCGAGINKQVVKNKVPPMTVFPRGWRCLAVEVAGCYSVLFHFPGILDIKSICRRRDETTEASRASDLPFAQNISIGTFTPTTNKIPLLPCADSGVLGPLSAEHFIIWQCGF